MAPAALAQGTSAQRAACTPDVFRLCASEIPNVDRITACLRRDKARLSQACLAVFNEMDRQQTATRSMTTEPAGARNWCAFGPNRPSGQEVWIAWCEESGQIN
jgi:hypothetical protein